MWFVSIILWFLLFVVLIAFGIYLYHAGYDDAYKELDEECKVVCTGCCFFEFTEDAVDRYYESGVGDHENYDPTIGLDKYMHMIDSTVECYRDTINKKEEA